MGRMKGSTYLLLTAVFMFLLHVFLSSGTYAWFSSTSPVPIAITGSWESLPDYPNWDPNTAYGAGDHVIYDGRVFWAQYYSKGNEPGTHVVWQEITNEWRWYNVYAQGDIVIYEGREFKSRHSGNQDKQPGLISSPWDELTDQWRFFNVYTGGEIVWYNGQQYRARWYTQNNQPDISSVWELIH